MNITGLEKNKNQNPYPARMYSSTFHQSYLAGIVEQLMLKFLDAEDLLEHFIQLVFAEDELGGSTGRDALLVLPGILLAAVDGVELSQPGAQHRLLAQAVDLG